MKDVSDLTYIDVNISKEEETVNDVNSSLQHESLKKEIQEEIKIGENKSDEIYTKVIECNEQLTQNNAQSEEKAEINLFLFNEASNNRTDKEILVDGTENISSAEGNTLTVLPQELNGTNLPQQTAVEENTTPEIRPVEEETHELCNLTSVIEISEDGTWNTAELPSDNIEQIKNQNVQTNENQNISQDFLTSSFSGSNLTQKSDNMHSAQYYINSQIESDKQKKHEKDVVSNECINEKARNIGAQIMEKYDEERQKIKDSKNLPDVSLLDVEESLEDIQKERRKIIESQAVRAKRIDSWIKGGSVGSSMEFEKIDLMDGQKSGDEQQINAQAIDYSWAQNPLLTQLMDYTPDGEVVYDSILENKQKTKVFWEQLMLAANLSTDPPSLTKTGLNVQSNIIEEKLENELSEPEFYDAQSHNILHISPEVTDGVDSPKIIEVSKKMASNTDDKITQNTTEGTETKITPNSEKDFKSIEDREQSLQQKLKKQAESKIVLEMREMREREEEWRRNQMAYQISLSSVGTASSFKEDEAFISIPTTDEGNYSEYGSEEKEEPILNGINRMMSPDASANQNVSSIGFQHQRTQSLDSMSSGHSSGSGSVTQLEQVPTNNRSGRRGITVKPLDEPEDDSSMLIWREKETPIEREIRIAYEREEELRREKSLPLKDSPTSTLKKESSIEEDEKTATETPKRLATKRIENEIEQARKREKELKQYHKEDVDTNETQSSAQILHGASNIVKSNIINTSLKTETSTLKQNKTTVSNSKPTKNINISTPPLEQKEAANNIQNKLFTSNNNVEASPKRFQPNPHQKGLMKRFLASRGKISSGFTFSTNQVEPSRSPVTPSPHPVATDMFFSSKSPRESYYDKTENSTLGSRPGYTSAEDKIQYELMEMRKREEELRRERARSLARSQPDLLSLVSDEEEREQATEEESHQETENLNKLPPMAKLRSALSNPSLLDIDIKQPPVQRKQKRKSALIEEWEYRIQQSHNNE